MSEVSKETGRSPDGSVLTGLEVTREQYAEIEALIRKHVKSHLNPEWTFVDKPYTSIEFNGFPLIKRF